MSDRLEEIKQYRLRVYNTHNPTVALRLEDYDWLISALAEAREDRDRLQREYRELRDDIYATLKSTGYLSKDLCARWEALMAVFPTPKET